MDGRLGCQTDETTDARGIYGLVADDCGECALDARMRGAPVGLLDDEEAGEMISLAKAALGWGQRGEARPIAARPVAAPAVWRGPRK